jgi:hypothetical protein
MVGRRERYKGRRDPHVAGIPHEEAGQDRPGLCVLPQPATEAIEGSEQRKGFLGRATKASGWDLRGVPAGDVEPGEAGEEGHDERDPAGGASGGGRGRLLGAAVLTPHGAGKRLHGGGRGDLRAPARAGLCFPLLLLTALHFLPLKKTVKVSQKKWQRLKGDSQVS